LAASLLRADEPTERTQGGAGQKHDREKAVAADLGRRRCPG
jgi:hypothetical protein